MNLKKDMMIWFDTGHIYPNLGVQKTLLLFRSFVHRRDHRIGSPVLQVLLGAEIQMQMCILYHPSIVLMQYDMLLQLPQYQNDSADRRAVETIYLCHLYLYSSGVQIQLMLRATFIAAIRCLRGFTIRGRQETMKL